MKHPSQYVDFVRQALGARQTSLIVIKNLLRKDGCEEESLPSCIYGACAQELQDRLGTQQQCEENPKLLATEAECLQFLKYYCPELADEEVEAILRRQQALGFIAIIEGYIYSRVRPVVNLPLEIKTLK